MQLRYIFVYMSGVSERKWKYMSNFRGVLISVLPIFMFFVQHRSAKYSILSKN